jgi:hypothetical protein
MEWYNEVGTVDIEAGKVNEIKSFLKPPEKSDFLSLLVP